MSNSRATEARCKSAALSSRSPGPSPSPELACRIEHRAARSRRPCGARPAQRSLCVPGLHRAPSAAAKPGCVPPHLKERTPASSFSPRPSYGGRRLHSCTHLAAWLHSCSGSCGGGGGGGSSMAAAGVTAKAGGGTSSSTASFIRAQSPAWPRQAISCSQAPRTRALSAGVTRLRLRF